MQQAVLRHFAGTGGAPEQADLEPYAADHGRTAGEVLDELAAEDFLTLGADGRVRAAYPFSAAPTAHTVRFPDGTTVWSMCAIDALGVPAMLGTDAVITSSDPVSGRPVIVTAVAGRLTWEPDTAVVYVGQRSCAGPAADTACGALNFFTGEDTARTWAARHPDHTGRVVGRRQAAALGEAVFGALLDDPPTA